MPSQETSPSCTTPATYVPIIEDIPTTRRPLPSHLPRELLLRTSQLTAEWFTHWHHYRCAVEHHAELQHSDVDDPVEKTGHHSSRLSTAEAARSLEEVEHTTAIQLWSPFCATTATSHTPPQEGKHKGQEEEEEEGHRDIPRERRDNGILSSVNDMAKRGRAAPHRGVLREDDAGSDATSVAEPHSYPLLRTAFTASSSSSSLPVPPQMEREWWHAGLSMAFSPNRRTDETAKPFSQRLELLMSYFYTRFHWDKRAPEAESLAPLDSSLRTGSEAPTRRAGHNVSKRQLKQQQQQQLLGDRLFPNTLWEDRKRRIDDLTLQTAPFPLQSSSRGEAAGSASQQKPTSGVLYPADICRMDAVVFRLRIQVLWELADLLEEAPRCSTPLSISVPPSPSPSWSSSTAGSIAWLCRHIWFPQRNSNAGFSIASTLRLRLLLELCVIRLQHHSPRCPFLWRTLAHMLRSYSDFLLALPAEEETSARENEQIDRSVSGESISGKEREASIHLWLRHAAEYIHSVLLPYLHFRDRYIESIRCPTAEDITSGVEQAEPEEAQPQPTNVDNAPGKRGGVRRERSLTGSQQESIPWTSYPSYRSYQPPEEGRYTFARQRIVAMMKAFPHGLSSYVAATADEHATHPPGIPSASASKGGSSPLERSRPAEFVSMLISALQSAGRTRRSDGVEQCAPRSTSLENEDGFVFLFRGDSINADTKSQTEDGTVSPDASLGVTKEKTKNLNTPINNNNSNNNSSSMASSSAEDMSLLQKKKPKHEQAKEEEQLSALFHNPGVRQQALEAFFQQFFFENPKNAFDGS